MEFLFNFIIVRENKMVCLIINVNYLECYMPSNYYGPLVDDGSCYFS